MFIYEVSIKNPKQYYKNLGCETTGANILSKKTEVLTLRINDLHVGAANILKQDALSIGADLAVPRGVILAEDKYVDAVLIANIKQLEILAKKELIQPFGLKKLAKELLEFIKVKTYKTKIMGVLNANEDSFFKNSRFKSTEVEKRVEKMIEDGADIIDIGAVSSRPGSIGVSADEELNRVKNIIDTLYANKYYDKVDFSIDSYEPLVIQYVLDRGFKIVNDITGLSNDEVCKLSAEYKAQVVIMHMQNDPKTMQNNPNYNDIIEDIDIFFNQRIQKAKDFGINDIVLDIGIGFGKNLNHNLLLLKNLKHFKHFGYELLVGASRKSLIENIVPNTPIEDRLAGTLAIHLKSIKNGASIIRCHDVKEHYQAMQVYQAIQEVS